jgi:hypothetical protein
LGDPAGPRGLRLGLGESTTVEESLNESPATLAVAAALASPEPFRIPTKYLFSLGMKFPHRKLTYTPRRKSILGRLSYDQSTFFSGDARRGLRGCHW